MSGSVRAIHAGVQPPAHDLEAEAAVLCAIIREPARLSEVRALLEPREFYSHSNRRIFETILSLNTAGQAIDVVSVASALRERGHLESCGGTPYLAQISDATPAVAHVAEHARLVKKAYRSRALVERLARANIEIRTGIDDVQTWTAQLADDLRAHGNDNERSSWPELDASEIFAPLDAIHYVFAPFDMCPGAPTLVAGYGFSGKTIALQSMAVSLAAGLPVWGSFSARAGRVLHIDWEQGPRLTRERYQRLAAAALVAPSDLEGRLSLVSMPQLYLDTPGAEPAMLHRCAGYDLAIIDSLKAACPSIEENDAAARNVLDMLTRVSVKTGCTFVVVHHARKPQRDATGGAKMSIRGSGALFDACGSVLVCEASKGAPTRVMHEKARTSGVPSEDIELRIADVEIDGNPRGGLSVSASAVAAEASARGGGRKLDELKDRIRDLFREQGDQAGKGAIRERLGLKRDSVFAAMAELEASGEVVNVGSERRPKLRLVEGRKP
ncbi:MAG: DnaB-like helicase N-terminal domain-containing protein [Myxococcota bacterium]